MTNFRGYFAAQPDCTQYEVDFIADPTDNSMTEISLAANSPFTIRYETSETPFEPARYSTAQINVVSDDYLFDLLSPHADGVQVILKKVDSGEIEWCGYLQANVLDQPYDSCVEDFTLNASDCLAVLRYFDYTQIGELRQIHSFREILAHLMDKVNLIKAFNWPKTKQGKYLEDLNADSLTVSEQNFFSDDPEDEEPWKMNEVLEEICRYFGVTAMQVKDEVYLVDYQFYCDNPYMDYLKYSKTANWENPEDVEVGDTNYIEQDSYKGNGGTISMDASYNKITVKDNFYYAEWFTPDIYNDDALTNRLGEWWKCEKVPPQPVGLNVSIFGETDSYKPYYLKKSGQARDADDNLYNYYKKVYDNRHYQSVYRLPKLPAELSGDCVYLCMTPDTSYTEYENVNLGEDILKSPDCTKKYVGGTIYDLGTIEKVDQTEWNYVYNKEAENDLDFDRYLMLNTCMMPYYSYAYIDPEPSRTSLDTFPSLFELKSGHTCPLIIDKGNTYITIDGEAIWEKYIKHDYINPDWTNENPEMPNNREGQSLTTRPSLFFLLKVGDMYWDGMDWGTTETGFIVPVEGKYETKKKHWDFAGNYNTPLRILNNVSWDEYSDGKGYKIPIPDNLDLNGEIKFEVHIPSQITHVVQDQNSGLFGTKDPWYHDGITSYIWIKGLELKVANKFSTQTRDDVVYENEIDAFSVNEMSEITYKLTTFPGQVGLAYSNVGYHCDTYLAQEDGLLEVIKEGAIDGEMLKPEENTLTKYYNMYSKPVKRENITVDTSFSPLNKIVDTYWGEDFVTLGSEIDVAEGKQTIDIVRLASKCTLSLGRNGSSRVAPAGGEIAITVKSTCPWKISADHSAWGSFNQTSGEAGQTTIIWTMDANTNKASRRITFTATAGDKVATISYQQAGGGAANYYITWNPAEQVVTKDMQTQRAPYYTNLPDGELPSVELRTDADWASALFPDGTVICRFEVDQNETGEARTAHFDAYYGSYLVGGFDVVQTAEDSEGITFPLNKITIDKFGNPVDVPYTLLPASLSETALTVTAPGAVWCEGEFVTGATGDKALRIQAGPNETGDIRRGFLYVKHNGVTIGSLQIWQSNSEDYTQFLEVNKTAMDYSYMGGAEEMTISTNGSWEIRNLPSWAVANVESGDNSANVTITVQPAAAGTKAKQATIRVYGTEGLYKDIVLTQSEDIPAPTYYVTFDPASYTAATTGQSITCTYTTNVPSSLLPSVSVSSNSEWINGRFVGQDFVAIANASYVDSDRNATLTLSLNGVTLGAVSFTQSTAVSKVSPTELYADSTGDSEDVIINITGNWRVVGNPAWVSPAVTWGTGIYTLNLTIEPNETSTGRTGVVAIWDVDNNKTYTVTISQNGTGPAPTRSISASPNPLNASSDPGPRTTVITYTGRGVDFISAEATVDWITLGPIKWNGEQAALTVTFTENESFTDTRHGAIILTPNELEPYTITVNQSPRTESLTISPASLSYTSEGGEKTLVITSNTDWEIINE